MDFLELAGHAMNPTAAHEAEAYAAQVALPLLLSGVPTWVGLKIAIDDLKSSAPQDCDVLIQFDDFAVHEVQFIEPHTFLFKGINGHGHNASIVCHFTQVKAHVIYRPKQGANRMITGFAPDPPGQPSPQSNQSDESEAPETQGTHQFAS
jgi:hypothetical protein